MVQNEARSKSIDAVRVITGNGAGKMMAPHDAVERVVDVIGSGGLALVPFDVAYAFLTGSLASLQRIYELKLRQTDKACPVLVSWDQFVDIADASRKEIERIEKIIRAGLPTGVLTRPKWDSATARSIPQDCVHLLLSNGKLALFMNMGGMSEELLTAATGRGIRLFGSSANISGAGNSFSLADVPSEIVAAMDIVCDTGMCKYGNPDRLPSSIVDLETGTLARRGILNEDILRLLEN